MFNKKLFLSLVFLLIILHISFVSAVEINETGIIENDTDYKTVINDDENDFDDDYDVTIIDFNQGDKIPITIDSSVEGNMTVLVDDKIYGMWSFSKNETILIPTYKPASFYNDSIKNINVGCHELSLIFKLNTFKNYIPVVSEENSHLYFQFHTYDDAILNNKYTYVHNSDLTIFEKRKTIELELLQYSYFLNVPVYFAGVGFDILLTTIKLNDIKNKHNNYSFGLIFSDSKKCLYKQDVSIGESLNIMDTIWVNGESIGITCEFWYDFPGLSYDVLRSLDVCEFTVINFMDGTSDSVSFNMSRYYNYVEKIDCIVNNNDVTFCFYQHFPKVFISIDEHGEFVSPKDNQWNVTFSNLSYGTHVMSLYCLKSDYSKELLRELTFEIKSLNPVDSFNNTLNIPTNNISFNMFPDMFLTTNGGFLVSNLDYGILTIENIIIDNSDYGFSEHKLGGELSSESKSQGSNSIGKSSSDDLSNNKAYEIQEKSVSKSIDNLITKLGLTIFSCMSLMVGYVRFEKKYQ